MNYEKFLPSGNLTAETITNATAKLWGLNPKNLTGKGRQQPDAFVRQVAMYLCYDLTTLSLAKVGMFFSNRNHATVLHAIKRIKQAMEKNPKMKTAVTELKKASNSQFLSDRTEKICHINPYRIRKLEDLLNQCLLFINSFSSF